MSAFATATVLQNWKDQGRTTNEETEGLFAN